MKARPHLVGLAVLGLLVGLVGAYAALPIAWRHYEHRRGLADRPMLTRTRQGIPGDPINIGVEGSPAQVACAFNAAGWRAASPVTWRSSLGIVGSVALRRPYPAAPVSPLFYQGRVEDLAFELADGASASRRHHVRLWRVVDDGTGRALWLGSDSFDRGVGFSHYTLRVTHHIDADLDSERDFLAAALINAGRVAAEYQISGIGPTVAGRNGGGDLYFTDGEVEIARLTGDCASAPAAAAPRHLQSPWPVRLRTWVWRLARPINRWRGEAG